MHLRIIIIAIMLSICCSVMIAAEDSIATEDSAVLTLDSSVYDIVSGDLIYSGTASCDIVNLRIRSIDGGDYVSIIDACIVDGGNYSGRVHLGALDNGLYELRATHNEVLAVRTFMVGDEYVLIKNVTYSDGLLRYDGETNAKAVNAILYNENYRSVIIASSPQSGLFSEIVNLGVLPGGVYYLKVMGATVNRIVSVQIENNNATNNQSVYSEDGKKLISCGVKDGSGFVIPDAVEEISPGAFDNASVGKLSFERDINWNTSVTNNKYPLQNAGVCEIEIGDGVTSIPDYLFACTDIVTITIPASVHSIGIKAFYNCENLVNVVFDDGTKMESVGNYAFSNNPNLSSIEFGSSAAGYSCTFELGCFYANPSLISFRIDEDFNLYSIGDGCFANCSQFSLLIGGESGNVIHIPGSVGYLGMSAFGSVSVSISQVEPGRNTISNIPRYTIGTQFNESISDYELIFESNLLLTEINQNCFAGVSFRDIDLSGCHALEIIYPGAFNGCLTVGNINLILPSNIRVINDGAFKCNGDYSKVKTMENLELVLPSSIEYVGEYAFQGLSNIISFESSSKLKEIKAVCSSNNVYRLIDLSSCLDVERLNSQPSKVKVPVGIFSIKYVGLKVSDETPVAIIEGNKLKITSSTVAIALPCDNNGIVTSYISDEIDIECDPSNPHIKYVDGFLTINNGVQSKIIYISDKTQVRLGMDLVSGTMVLDHALPSALRTLYLDNGDIYVKSALVKDSTNLRSVFINTNPVNWSIPQVFSDVSGNLSFFVQSDVHEDDLRYLMGVGEVYIGYKSGNHMVYCPTSYGDTPIVFNNVVISDSSLSAEISLSKTSSESIEFLAIGARASITNGRIIIDNYAENPIIILKPFETSPQKEYFTVSLSGNGGLTSDGRSTIVIKVASGSTINFSLIPEFVKSLSVADGWFDSNGNRFSGDTPVDRNLVLTQVWTQRNPVVMMDQSSAYIFVDGVEKASFEFIEEQVTLTAVPKSGYELQEWVVGGIIKGPASMPLVLENTGSDVYVTIQSRYYSISSGLNAVNNTYMLTSEEISDLVQAFAIGGFVDTTMSTWVGTSSVPLVVGDYIYLRIAESLYKIESDTGYVVKRVDSESRSAFYHQLGYGGGIIIDYHTSKVYDLDLNQLFKLDRYVSGVEYYDGMFYTSGETVYCFSPEDENPDSPDETKISRKIGTISGVYSSYGFSMSCFVDNYLYRVVADGTNRGVAAMNLDSGEVTYCMLNSLTSMYLDDGWISYYGGYLFLSGYTQGLFGASATAGSDVLAYVPVLGGEFGIERSVTFNKAFGGVNSTAFASQFVIAGNRGFINAGGTLYVFDLPENLSDLDLTTVSKRSISFALGHGSIVLDASYVNEEGAPIYVYAIPYDSHYGATLCVAKDCGGVLTKYDLYSTAKEWNSQAVRSDANGRLMWYNDSGWIYSYTTSENNVYYFFIENGDSAVWYRACGANAADALASLGNDVATLNSAKIIQTVNGHSVSDGITLEMLKATYGTVDNNGQFDNLDQYSWVTITNLGDVSYSLNHYFRIICGNGESVTAGTEFSYVEDGERKTYTFADNIGDRSIIGKQLSRGTEVVFLRFYDEGGNELPDTASVVKSGSSVKIHFPEVSRAGYVPVWKDSSNNGNEVSDIYGMEFTSDASFYLTWEPLPPGYLVTGVMETTSGTTVWSADVIIKSGVGSVADLQVKVTAVTSDGRVLSEVKVTAVDGKASGTFETADVALIYIRIVDEHVEGNLGYAMIEKEARP